MDCSEARRFVDALVDGELDTARREWLEAHLAGCPACRELVEARRALIHAVKVGAPRFPCPEDFRVRLRAAIPSEPSGTADPLETPHRSSLPRRQRWWAGMAWGSSAAALAASLTLFALSPSHQEELQRELVEAHVRSLMASHLVDVGSSDKHAVKPWFAGRVDLSPAVPDLSAHGFPLVGGRLDYIDDRAAAAVVYRRGQHLINVFVWPEAEGPERGLAVASRNGYTIMKWRKSGIAYAVVSDLNIGELTEFQRLWSEGG